MSVVSDPLADMFTRVRNAANARHETVRVPASNVKRAVADVLRQEGFIRDVNEVQDGPRAFLELRLTYADDRRAVLTGIRRVSRPGLRVYVNNREVPRVFGGLGVAIMSTSQGVMSGREAWRRRVGGEVLCYVW
jgi:small subunit ribosomal protein S8